MVRLIETTDKRGRKVWREDAPTECPAGHRRLVPSYGGCPVCSQPVRLWQCRAEGCEQVLYDDEHVHHSRR